MESKTRPDHSGIFPRTASASVVCACGVTVPQNICNGIESDWIDSQAMVAIQAARIAELERERNEAKEAADAYSKGVYSETMLRAAKAIGDNTHLTLALSQAKDALKELVACKDLKDRADEIVRTIPYGKNIIDHPAYQEWLTVRTDYGRRKPLAWAAARKFLSTPERA